MRSALPFLFLFHLFHLFITLLESWLPDFVIRTNLYSTYTRSRHMYSTLRTPGQVTPNLTPVLSSLSVRILVSLRPTRQRSLSFIVLLWRTPSALSPPAFIDRARVLPASRIAFAFPRVTSAPRTHVHSHPYSIPFSVSVAAVT